MFKDSQSLLDQIKHDPNLLSALQGIDDISDHLRPTVENFLIERCLFKRPTRNYEKVQFLWEKKEAFELVQYHVRLEPGDKSSYRTSRYHLSGDWTVIAQVIINQNFNIKQVIALDREVVEKNMNDKPWTIGKCLKLGQVIFSLD